MERRQAHRLFGLAAGMSLIIVCLLLSGCRSQSPDDVVREFVMLLAARKYEAAAEHVLSSDRELFIMEARTGGLSELYSNGGLSQLEITSVVIDGNAAEVDFEVHFKDGEWSPYGGDLVRVGRLWKISIY